MYDDEDPDPPWWNDADRVGGMAATWGVGLILLFLTILLIKFAQVLLW